MYIPDRSLKAIAEVQQTAEAKVDRLFHRIPFIWVLILAIFACGGWTAIIAWRVSDLEDYKKKLSEDQGVGIIEQAHTNRRDIEHHTRQLQRLNNKVFGLQEPD